MAFCFDEKVLLIQCSFVERSYISHGRAGSIREMMLRLQPTTVIPYGLKIGHFILPEAPNWRPHSAGAATSSGANSLTQSSATMLRNSAADSSASLFRMMRFGFVFNAVSPGCLETHRLYLLDYDRCQAKADSPPKGPPESGGRCESMGGVVGQSVSNNVRRIRCSDETKASHIDQLIGVRVVADVPSAANVKISPPSGSAPLRQRQDLGEFRFPHGADGAVRRE